MASNSGPEGASVNSSIDPALCAVSLILRTRRRTQLAKVDVEHAYRNVPVHAEDRHLVDTVLPFGLRSAPNIFLSTADALLSETRGLYISLIF